GDNEFIVDNVNNINMINLKSGSNTTLLDGFKLTALKHSFNLNRGATLTVHRNTNIIADSAVLSGKMIFDLDEVNNITDPMLNITSGMISINGSTAELARPGNLASLNVGDKFYLINGSTTLRGVSASEGKIQTIKHGSLLEAVVRFTKLGNDFYAEVVSKNDGGLNAIQPMSSNDDWPEYPEIPEYPEDPVCGGDLSDDSDYEVPLIDGETGEVIPRSTTITSLSSPIELANSVETTDLALSNQVTELTASNSSGNSEDAESLVSGAESITRSNIVGIALANQGADLAAGKGMESAVNSAKKDAWGAFGAVSAGSTRYNSIDVDASSVNVIAGISRGVDTEIGQLTAGVFFEYGSNTYDTHGSGNASYIGGGLLGRMDFANTGNGHFYTEATARIGGLNNNFDSNVLSDGYGRKAGYEIQSTYYGIHFGTGYMWNISEDVALDVYGKYFWSHQDANDVGLSTGETVKFDAVDSHRLRGGARLSYAINEFVSPYIGAAYEHEFAGELKASVYGYDIKAAKLEGGTGIGEIGLAFKSSDQSPWFLDLGVQGYTGQREGIGGSLRVGLEF
ncbi:MAG: autotransporter outer membrane beta-barrel domain-containing protein, partial [Desulfovibrio sp.]|nr:autotransporter outer membrane beta-barrel domain-containing protein [Desulfovibrio sp.]